VGEAQLVSLPGYFAAFCAPFLPLPRIIALAPSFYTALGMIAQRKPNQDKGFKDLPLNYGALQPVF
jgi:hypothetical protein